MKFGGNVSTIIRVVLGLKHPGQTPQEPPEGSSFHFGQRDVTKLPMHAIDEAQDERQGIDAP